MATEKQVATRVFDALAETRAALMDPVKAGIDRTHRFATAITKEVEWAQQETLAFGKQFAEQPADVAGLSSAAFQKSAEAQDRAFEFVRLSVEEMASATREMRTAVERITQANVELAQPTVEAVQGLIARTRVVFRPIVLFGNDEEKTAAPTPRKRATAPSDEAA